MWSIPLDSEDLGFVEVCVGEVGDGVWPCTAVFGLSVESIPMLGQSETFKIKWPGVESLYGMETHQNGNCIGWKGADPMAKSPERSVLKKAIFPGEVLQVGLWCGRVVLLHELSLLHQFDEEVPRHEKLYFHAYVQDVESCSRCSVPPPGPRKLWYRAVPRSQFGPLYRAKLRMQKSFAQVSSVAESKLKGFIQQLSEFDPLTGNAMTGGHRGWIVGLALTPDQEYLITASTDGTLKIWSTKTGSCRCTVPQEAVIEESVFVAHFAEDKEPKFHSLCCIPDSYCATSGSTTFVTGMRNGSIHAWRLRSVAWRGQDESGKSALDLEVVHLSETWHRSEGETSGPRGVGCLVHDSQRSRLYSTDDSSVKAWEWGGASFETPRNPYVPKFDADSLPEQPPMHTRRSCRAKTASKMLRRIMTVGLDELQDQSMSESSAGCRASIYGRAKRRKLAEVWRHNQSEAPEFEESSRVCAPRQISACGDHLAVAFEIFIRTPPASAVSSPSSLRSTIAMGKEPSLPIRPRLAAGNDVTSAVLSPTRQISRRASEVSKAKGLIQILDLRTGDGRALQPEVLFQIDHAWAVTSVTLAASRLFFGDNHGNASCYSDIADLPDPPDMDQPPVPPPEPEQIFRGHAANAIWRCMPLRHGERDLLLTCCGDNTVKIFPADNLKCKLDNGSLPPPAALRVLDKDRARKHDKSCARSFYILEDVDPLCYRHEEEPDGLQSYAYVAKDGSLRLGSEHAKNELSTWGTKLAVSAAKARLGVAWRTQNGRTSFSMHGAESSPAEVDPAQFTVVQQPLLTLCGHTGAVTCAVHTASEVIGIGADDVDAAHKTEIMQSSVFYTASFDCAALRWNLTDILPDLCSQGSAEAERRAAASMQRVLSRRTTVAAALVTGVVKHTLAVPQQEYRSTSLSQALKAPVSWLWTLLLLCFEHEEDAGMALPGRYLFWSAYTIGLCVALVLILVLVSDRHALLREEIAERQSRKDFGINPECQKEVQGFEQQLSTISAGIWVISQILWLPVLRMLVMIFDCTHYCLILGLDEIGLCSILHGPAVLESDPRLTCFGRVYWLIAAPNAIILLLYVSLSAPLIVALGNMQLLKSDLDHNTLERFCVRVNPRHWLWGVRRRWPLYGGAFARRRKSYVFEMGLYLCKVGMPLVSILTTFHPEVRCWLHFVLGLILFIIVCVESPAQGFCFTLALRALVLVLMMRPIVRHQVNMHTALHDAEVSCKTP